MRPASTATSALDFFQESPVMLAREVGNGPPCRLHPRCFRVRFCSSESIFGCLRCLDRASEIPKGLASAFVRDSIFGIKSAAILEDAAAVSVATKLQLKKHLHVMREIEQMLRLSDAARSKRRFRHSKKRYQHSLSHSTSIA